MAQDATPATLYQAASLSKFVAAVGAMRLVERRQARARPGRERPPHLLARSRQHFDATHNVTLRGLLSMTGGIGVPGFIGYEAGRAAPDPDRMLNGTPPANSPPVTVIAMPGSAYHYSGGGYEITEALMQDVAGKPFTELMQDLVLGPAGMSASSFAQPFAPHLAPRPSSGHYSDGAKSPGAGTSFPNTPRRGCGRRRPTSPNFCSRSAAPGAARAICSSRPDTVREMLTPQNGGPYGLGAAVSGDGGDLGADEAGPQCRLSRLSDPLSRRAGQGIVVMTNSDNGSMLAEALIARAATAYRLAAVAAPCRLAPAPPRFRHKASLH